MGDLYDAAPPWMQEAMQQHDEFRQALSAVEGEGGKLGDLIEYAVLFRAQANMARNNTPLPPERQRRMDELEATLRDAGVSREALHRLGMAFGGEGS